MITCHSAGIYYPKSLHMCHHQVHGNQNRLEYSESKPEREKINTEDTSIVVLDFGALVFDSWSLSKERNNKSIQLFKHIISYVIPLQYPFWSSVQFTLLIGTFGDLLCTCQNYLNRFFIFFFSELVLH